MLSQFRYFVVMLLVAGGVFAGCNKPAATPPVSTPVTPMEGAPRLFLQLQLGDKPEQPGRTPSRVGGVSEAGPRSFAMGNSGEVYILDNAHLRLMRFEEGKFHSDLPLPWLDEVDDSLLLRGDQVFVRSASREIVFDASGRIAREAAAGVYPFQRTGFRGIAAAGVIGTDSAGRTYHRTADAKGGSIGLERRDGDGHVLARAPEPTDVVDWYVTPNGGLYTMSWVSAGASVDSVRVDEVLPPDHKANAPMVDGPKVAGPKAFGVDVPTSARVAVPGWAPVTLTDQVDLHNLWRFLSTAEPYSGPPPGSLEAPVLLSASLADGKKRDIKLLPDFADVDGQLYTYSNRVWSMIQALAFTPATLKLALQDGTVTIVNADLPDSRRKLTDAEKKVLVNALAGAVAAAPQSMPQPLEKPFPRYRLELDGPNGKSAVDIRGDRHLAFGWWQGIALQASLSDLAKTWLPVPKLEPGDVAYLYRALALDLNDQNLTRWKATVVRHLLGVTPIDPQSRYPYDGPFTLTFVVDGKPLVVTVDESGFTYAGRRYQRTGLASLRGLTSVP